MPKEADYTIAWSNERQGYEILHTPFRFPLTSTDTLVHWLSIVSSVHFCSRTGLTLTLRKERKQRGAGYWYAYKHVNGKLCKKYLGETSKLDLQILETVAQHFVELVQATQTQPRVPPHKPTLAFTRTLESALKIYGFPSIPSRRQLLARYRELSKQHHPDAGGSHENMVAVNLAYEYLKRFVDDRR
jgi:hypothetical protein